MHVVDRHDQFQWVVCDEIRIGMTPTEVRALLGGPQSVSHSTFASGTVENWTYIGENDSKRPMFEFENGVLAAITD